MLKIDEITNRRIGRRLREARIPKGFTLTKLAERLGVSYQQLQKYESGVNVITPGKLIRLAEILGVSVGHFFDVPESGPLPDESPNRKMMHLMRSARKIERCNPELFQALCDTVSALAKSAPSDSANPAALS
jgi:transcriptional regulator with XRE-family HTH domain